MSLQQEKGHAIPKFGEWDVNDPASADEFSFVFAKASKEKASGNLSTSASSRYDAHKQKRGYKNCSSNSKRRWFCCG